MINFVLSIAVMVPTTACAAKPVAEVLRVLTPAYVKERIRHPEVNQRLCDLLLTRSNLAAEESRLLEQESAYAAQIREGVAQLGPFFRWTHRIVPYDHGERIQPSKLIRQVRRDLRRIQSQKQDFELEFESRVIAALRPPGQNYFQRLMDQREQYAELRHNLAVAVSVVSDATAQLIKLEAAVKKAEMDQLSEASVRRKWLRVDRYLRNHRAQVIEVIQSVNGQLPHHYRDPVLVVKSSKDLRQPLNQLLRVELEVERICSDLEAKYNFVIDQATKPK